MSLPDRFAASASSAGEAWPGHSDRLGCSGSRAIQRPGERGLIRLAAWMAVLLFGCDRNIEPYRPGEEPRAPDLARIFPKPTGETGEAGASMADRAALPPSRNEGSRGPASGEMAEGSSVAPASATGGAEPISGRVELAPGLAGARPAGAILFVIARPQGARGGPPLAVLRIPQPEFPYAFQIGPADVMIPSMRFEGPISLTARLDEDGNAMTRGENDLSSEPAEPLTPGTVDVALVLGRQG